jgi:hypothetical protein
MNRVLNEEDETKMPSHFQKTTSDKVSDTSSSNSDEAVKETRKKSIEVSP